jgi:hypothetical protein
METVKNIVKIVTPLIGSPELAPSIIYFRVVGKRETFITRLIEFSSEMVLPHLERKRSGPRYQSRVQSCSLSEGFLLKRGNNKKRPMTSLKKLCPPGKIPEHTKLLKYAGNKFKIRAETVSGSEIRRI